VTDPFANLPRGHFKAISADPPWSFRGFNEITSERSVEAKYSTMSAPDICALPVREIAARDCHLFIWTTGPKLPETFKVIEAWGFTYSAMGFVWIKQKRSLGTGQFSMLPTEECDLHVGLGYTTRKNAEFCLLARRGNAKRNAADVREIIMAPVREHSRKPPEAADRIERYCDGPYLELFARAPREGWTVWGNETDKFEAAA
jgi:N6-adenosine-specific RNA methylase IME4